MKKTYNIGWIDEVYKSQDVEAENEEEALKMFFNGECNNYSTEDAEYIEDSLRIEEVEE